jgi:glycine cleavage system aminomethyltransferase T
MADDQVLALRSSAAYGRSRHVSCIRVSGRDAFEAVDEVCTAELFLRDTQIRSGLLLDDDAHVIADVFVCRDDEDFILLAEGPSTEVLIGHFWDSTAAGREYDLLDLMDDRQIISLSGPFSWEVMAELLGPEVVGLPYLFLLRIADGFCFRTGKTGEFGYDLLLDAPAAALAWERLQELSPAYDMLEVELAALDQCALENWFFNIRREGRLPVTPIELQLQWRTSYQKAFRGSGALAQRRKDGIDRRLTTLVAAGPIAEGDSVQFEGSVIGEIVNAGYSPARKDHIGLALLDLPYASAGVRYDVVRSDGGAVRARTVSPPVINNRSLHVSPQLHSYRTRDEIGFPDLIPIHAPAG